MKIIYQYSILENELAQVHKRLVLLIIVYSIM